MTVITRGERELTLRFDTFPEAAHKRLEERVSVLTETLWARVESVVPHRTGQLASEIEARTYGDQPTRVAGYVSVRSSSGAHEYEKAGALEYGWWARRDPSSGVMRRIMGNNRRMKARMGEHVNAFRYLRGPLEEMRPEIEATLDEALAEAAAEGNA